MTTIMPSPLRSEPLPVHEPECPSLPELPAETLPNGLTLHILDSGITDVNRLSVLLPEPPPELLRREANPAARAMWLQMLREGPSGMPEGSFPLLMEGNGSWLGCTAGPRYSTFTLYSLDRCYPRVADAFAETISHPAFPEHALAVAASRSAHLREADYCKVSFMAMQESMRLFYGPGHILGEVYTPEQMLAVTSEMLRTRHAAALVPGRVHAFLSGKVTQSVLDTTRRALGRLELTAPAAPDVMAPPLPCADGGSVTHVKMPQAAQSALRFTIPAIGRSHPDYEPLRIAVTALGGFFSSRLNANIREEKGLTYGINSALLGYPDFSCIAVACQCDPAYTGRVIAEVRSEIERMATVPFTPDEMRRLRHFYISSLISNFETPFTLADYFEGTIATPYPTDYFERQRLALERMTPDSLARVSELYLRTDRLVTVMAGPAAS